MEAALTIKPDDDVGLNAAATIANAWARTPDSMLTGAMAVEGRACWEATMNELRRRSTLYAASATPATPPTP